VCTNARIALLALAMSGAAWCAAPGAGLAQPEAPPTPSPTSPPAASAPASAGNLLNPNLSVIGWFQAEAGDRVSAEGGRAFALHEAEIGLQAAVDPYSRADFFISVSPDEGAALEEGYVTFLSLASGLSAKLGKFRQNFGKFNRTHPPEMPFADRPLVAERFLGEEGLAGTGASASWLVPLPLYLNLDVEVTNTPSRGEVPAFESYRGKDLLYTTRLGTFFDLGEAANLSLGASYANGANGAADADTVGSSFIDVEILRAQLQGLDVTFRWKNPRRAIYRSLVFSVEVMQRAAETLSGHDYVSRGAFTYADYQFSRRWHAGGRYDWSESLDAPGQDATGALAFLTFTPSEFSLMSLQASRRWLEDGAEETRYFFKTTFNIGPHGAHPF
jgi:hypothetical protein